MIKKILIGAFFIWFFVLFLSFINPLTISAQDDLDLPPPPDAEEDFVPPPPGEGEEVAPPAEEGELPPPPEGEEEMAAPPAEEGELPPPPEGEEEMAAPPAEEGELPPPPEGEEEVAAPPAEEGELAPPPVEEEEVPPPVEEKAEKPAKPSKKYKVKKGDSLWKISGKSSIYGNSFKWPLLFKANRRIIEDPDLIYPRQRLKVRYDFSTEEVEDAIQKAKETPPYEPHTKPRKRLPIKY